MFSYRGSVSSFTLQVSSDPEIQLVSTGHSDLQKQEGVKVRGLGVYPRRVSQFKGCVSEHLIVLYFNCIFILVF